MNATMLSQGARGASFALPGFEARRGGHCESSAMLNALAYLGYGVSEADIVGGGGAPSFIFTNDAFPFLGARNERMREIFLEAARVPSATRKPRDGDCEWDNIASLLERGIPALVRVDMRYLPYLYGGRYGPPYMSFGGHWVCVFGLDRAAGLALVTDTANQGPREIKIADLDKARRSRTRMYPPRGEYAWVEPKRDDWTFDADAVTKKAFAEIASNYDSSPVQAKYPSVPLVGLAGLAAFPDVLGSIHENIGSFALAPAYAFMAGSIERNGTGGAAFRRLFRDFLLARAADCRDPRLRVACSALVKQAEAAMAAWSALAAAFDAAASALKAARGGARKAAIAETERDTSGRAGALYEAERGLRDAIVAARG